jgi:hypothetical protein
MGNKVGTCPTCGAGVSSTAENAWCMKCGEPYPREIWMLIPEIAAERLREEGKAEAESVILTTDRDIRRKARRVAKGPSRGKGGMLPRSEMGSRPERGERGNRGRSRLRRLRGIREVSPGDCRERDRREGRPDRASAMMRYVDGRWQRAERLLGLRTA